jgi:NAD(P)-dependent dehydrogenase (short-subunit alcohol dehydrogenase family)
MLGMQPKKSRSSLNHSLEQQRIIIIGGTSGFGMATAKAASAEGATVMVASSRKANVDRALNELPPGMEGHVLDVTQESAVADFFSTVGEFDHLVFTAGETLDLGEFASADLKRARRFFETRFWGAITATRYAAKRIKSTGSIILTGGLAGLRPQKGWVIAAAIMGALEAATRALAIELAPVRVNLVCAGLVRTELWRTMTETDRNSLFESVGQVLPVGRVGEPEDLAETYLYLMRERFSTGAMVVVDGGGSLV